MKPIEAHKHLLPYMYMYTTNKQKHFYRDYINTVENTSPLNNFCLPSLPSNVHNALLTKWNGMLVSCFVYIQKISVTIMNFYEHNTHNKRRI